MKDAESYFLEISELASRITVLLPAIKSGALRLWGEPLGRPGEDWHKLIACTAVDKCLRLEFADGEVLAV
jgi:hypothetical protein